MSDGSLDLKLFSFKPRSDIENRLPILNAVLSTRLQPTLMRANVCAHLNLLSRYDPQFVSVEYCTMITRSLSCLIILSSSCRRTKPVFVS